MPPVTRYQTRTRAFFGGANHGALTLVLRYMQEQRERVVANFRNFINELLRIERDYLPHARAVSLQVNPFGQPIRSVVYDQFIQEFELLGIMAAGARDWLLNAAYNYNDVARAYRNLLNQHRMFDTAARAAQAHANL